MLAFVQFLLFVISCYSAQLKTDYAVDETFSVANSPYYVSADAVIRDGVTITVENGVEIIFMDDYTIHVRGTFDFCNVDTSITTDRGLYLATKGYIHADSSLVRQGSIAFDSGTNGKGLFCNVLFENLYIAINTNRDGLASPYVATIDNCEFSNIFRVFDGESFVGDASLFTDSYFHNIDEVAYQSQATFHSQATFRNCLFENFGTILVDSSFNGFYFTFTGNTITGDGTQNCFKIQRSILENNTIDNCVTAIKTDTYYNTIQYNVLSNHDIAVDMGGKSSPDTDTIQYNNFIGNTINLQNRGDTDAPDCIENYFGTSSTDQSAIAGTMNDICDGYSSGLITWWPYYLTAIDFNDLSNVPQTNTFTELLCPGVDNGHNVVGSKLNVIYVADTSWTASESPYYVVNDIVISDGVTITVENGVEIIFMDDYTIHVRGTFDFCNVDTSITTDRGLYLATKGYIHADSSLVRQGSIAFDSGTNGKGLFCNVLFENLNIAINTDRDGLASPYVVTVDNCEFSDIFRVFDGESFVGDVSLFTDSYFHNIDEVAYQSQATFQNCLFE
eukprot:881332_1